MRGYWKYILATACVAGLFILMISIDVMSENARKGRVCKGIDINIRANDNCVPVSDEEIKLYIDRGCGALTGRKLSEIDLKKIEDVLNEKSAILSSEAYTAHDSCIHVDVFCREAVALFKTSVGNYYTDRTGFMFPVTKECTLDIPTIDGNVPARPQNGVKGYSGSEKGKKWLEGLIGMLDYIGSHKRIGRMVARIHVNDNGEIVLYPKEGKERFVFGGPEDYETKFRKMDNYYKEIVPHKTDVSYRTVILKYEDQIICRK